MRLVPKCRLFVVLAAIFTIILSLTGFGISRLMANTAPSSPYNNEGISPDNNTSVGHFDASNNSYSNNLLTNAGFGSGMFVTVQNLIFQWPTVTAGGQRSLLATVIIGSPPDR